MHETTIIQSPARILKVSGAVVSFVVLYLFAAIIFSSITIEKEKGTPEEVGIYIKTNGVHTDIVVPVKTDLLDWSKEVKYSNTHLIDSNCSYLAMGWGDKGFYLQTPEWADLKFSVAFNAAFGLSSSAMHATYYSQMQENESCRKIVISKEQYKRLTYFLLNSFQRDDEGNVMNIKTNANYGLSDAFYEAKGRYNLFYTCNTWANAALKYSGQKCCLWTIFDKGIFAKYKD